ncbi:MAG: hypothetical protein QOE70_1827 [Chthoniobacter sp.]|jgi:hypothetical protein|nr:hypothetical protein [Chthoniobacter sp.]
MKSKTILFTLFAARTLFAADPVTLSLKDFTDGKGGPPLAGWVTESDGTIHRADKGGNIISKEEYASFELEWEWKVAPGGNNGVKYWVTKIDGKEWLGIEYQMIDDERHPDGMRGGSHNTASIYDIKDSAKDKAVKPAGEWNTSKVVVNQGKIEHWLNGKLAVAADTNGDEWKAAIAKSKFKDKPGFAPGKGHLMLTDHGDETWFRNIRVKAL